MSLGRLLGRHAGRLTGTLATLVTRLVDRASDVAGSREAALAVGSVSLLLAVLVALLPAAWLPSTVAVAGDLLLANRRAIFVVGVVTGIAGVWWLSERSEPDDEPSVTMPERPPEFAYFTEGRLVGEAIDRATSGEDLAQWEAGKFRRETYDQLSEAAVTAISEAENCTPQAARDSLDAGTWTDSPRAARFLGDESETRLPLSTRIRDWASGEAYRRHVRDTVEAVVAIDPEYDGDVSVADTTTANAATDRRTRAEYTPQPTPEQSTATVASDDRRWDPGDTGTDSTDTAAGTDADAEESEDNDVEESETDTGHVLDHEIAAGAGGERV